MKQKYSFIDFKNLVVKVNSLTFLSVVLLSFFVTKDGVGALRVKKERELKYKTSFGNCPSRVAGTLTLQLMKSFEKGRSLRTLKQKIIREKLVDKHFIEDYKIQYNPLKSEMAFSYTCPEPLMKVQIYKENGLDSYEAILVSNGKLFDPTYEVLLRGEKKLKYSLPFLAIPVGDMDEKIQNEITSVVKQMGLDFRKKISEIILGKNGELTVILSLKGHPSSVFLGSKEWKEKIGKLMKIVRYMEVKKKIPAIINLTNSKKVVVKFNDRF